jgi:hypothetical protein
MATTNRLMLFREITPVCIENHTEHVKARNAEVFKV